MSHPGWSGAARPDRLAPVALLFLLLFSIRLALALQLPLHPDEAYYWMWSRFPDLSYYDQGPGIAWAIRLFTFLFGDTHLALKIAAATLSSLAAVILVPTGVKMGLSFRNALIAAVGYSLLPGIWGGSLLILHDSLLLLFWNGALLITMITLDRLNRQDSVTLPLLGLALVVGLGMLAKHTMILLPTGLLLWWILSGRHGFLLRHPALYAAAASGLLAISPMLVWNLQHDFAGIDAIRYLRSSGAGIDHSASTGRLLLGQILAVSPVPFFLLLAGLAVGGWHLLKPATASHKKGDRIGSGGPHSIVLSVTRILKRWREIPAPVSFATLLTTLVFGFFFVLSFRSTVQGNWLFPAYGSAMLLIMAGIQTRRMSLRVIAGLFLLTGGPLVALASGLLPSAVSRSLPYSISADRKLGGLQEVVADVRRFRDEKAPGTPLLATRYQDASIASFYLPEQPYVPSLNLLMQNQYSYWPLPQKNADYVVFLFEDDGCSGGPDYLKPSLSELFTSVGAEGAGRIRISSGGSKYWKAYLVRGFRGFPDAALAEAIRSRLIQYFMPTLKTPTAMEHKDLTRISENLVQVVAQEKARKKDCNE